MEVNTVLKSYFGKSYRLTRLLGQGGEGSVFETDIPGSVIKIYDSTKSGVAARMPELEKKLLYMVNTIQMKFISKASGNCLVSWPQDVLYKDGKFVGYMMPKVTGAKSILQVNRGGASARKVIPDYSWKKAALVAENLAKVVRALHAHDVVIGDMNSNNILVYPNCDVAIIDSDSFDIRTKDGKHYKCKVGTAPFLPPELQNCDLSKENASFTKESDEFALAVHIFQLLMRNFHPFNAKAMDASKSDEKNKQEYNIKSGNCPFIRRIPGYDIPLGAPVLDKMLPQNLVQDFRKTFGYQLDERSPNYMQQLLGVRSQRTSADTWYTHLHEMNASMDRAYVRCQQNGEHYYLQAHGSCELCAANTRLMQSVPKISSSSRPSTPPRPSTQPGQPTPPNRPTSPGPQPTPNRPTPPGPQPTPNQPTPPQNNSCLGTVVRWIAGWGFGILILYSLIDWFQRF